MEGDCKVITYQDYELAEDKLAFILSTISEYKGSDFYQNAMKSRAYYTGNNDMIFNRLNWFMNSSGYKEEDKFKANNQVGCEFYPKIIKQANSYLLSNGLSVDEDIKKGLGKTFDVKLLNAGLGALIDGVSWIYCYTDGKQFLTKVLSGTEVIPLYDEMTSEMKLAIRYWQIADNKPMYVEVYDSSGITTYKTTGKSELQVIKARMPYRFILKSDVLDQYIDETLNWSKIPLIPLYSNELKANSLTKALKSKIDLYDIVMSDFGNNLEDNNDVYWILKNYQGQDIGEFLADLKYYKAVHIAGDGSADAKQLDVPYQARQVALDILRKEIFNSAMALDTSVLSGGSLTNVAIKANMTDLDLKTDLFENEALETCDAIIRLYIEFDSSVKTDYELAFIRRTIVNDTETVDNIQKFRMDISQETALELNPYIEDVEREMKRLEEESIENYELNMERQIEMGELLNGENGSSASDNGKATKETGKRNEIDIQEKSKGNKG